MNFSDLRFWIAVAAMALITWLTRALPFLGGQQRLDAIARPDSPLSLLGPSLLAAICAAVIVPDLMRAMENMAAAPYLLGLLCTAILAKVVENAGVAVLLSLACHGALLAAFAPS